ncbi:copper chaperone PCu(A)C [Demequina sp. SYSU T00192]|uniref:Copper chaperone PCu(A)C n=1 Tax=Demequina litoralis TaxID=3051660 RepID=A0ABT8GBJ0_9MICO|nr:copper chaperone PCu(A)C [Demequina sp. SYSU T00192]MDN4476029.1 copper chaperone PCu(A)C [Demequina sp. SYSU T00192]
MSIRPRFLATAAVALAAATALAGCASDTASSEAALTVTDPWVKTAATEDMMSAAFGTLVNTTDEDVTVVAATSDQYPALELHEVVDGAMQELGDGMVVPAGGELALEPGGFHIMVMELPEAIEPGDEVDFTLELADGSTVGFTATAKDFDGGNEEYHDSGSDDMEMEMDMSSDAPEAEPSH